MKYPPPPFSLAVSPRLALLCWSSLSASRNKEELNSLVFFSFLSLSLSLSQFSEKRRSRRFGAQTTKDHRYEPSQQHMAFPTGLFFTLLTTVALCQFSFFLFLFYSLQFVVAHTAGDKDSKEENHCEEPNQNSKEVSFLLPSLPSLPSNVSEVGLTTNLPPPLLFYNSTLDFGNRTPAKSRAKSKSPSRARSPTRKTATSAKKKSKSPAKTPKKTPKKASKRPKSLSPAKTRSRTPYGKKK